MLDNSKPAVVNVSVSATKTWSLSFWTKLTNFNNNILIELEE